MTSSRLIQNEILSIRLRDRTPK
jgi:hypothetical protein